MTRGVVMLFCAHDEIEGAEGPIVLLGRWPILWTCVQCGNLEIWRKEEHGV